MEQATAWAKLRAARGVLARAQVDWNMRSLRLAADALAGAEQEHTALLLEREGRLGEKLEATEAERAGLQATLPLSLTLSISLPLRLSLTLTLTLTAGGAGRRGRTPAHGELGTPQPPGDARGDAARAGRGAGRRGQR